MSRSKIKDFYFHKAKREKYSARSVYKLQNIQEKYHVFAPGNWVLDLGAAPGSWTEYVTEMIGRAGRTKAPKRNPRLWCIDPQPLSLTAQEKLRKFGIDYEMLQRSVFDPLPEETPIFDVVLSDMAPFTQGDALVDSSRSLELVKRAYEICESRLKQGGHFVVKLFQSDDTVQFAKSIEKQFKFAKLHRPPAVAKESKEIYFVGMHFLLGSKPEESNEK